jgi:FkbM family methyltransferase
MTNYWDSRFLQHLDIKDVKIVFEVGARYGDESIKLSETFENALIYSFECNPLTVNKCRENLKNHKNQNKIIFNDFGLGDKQEVLPFYSFIENNDGASSLLKRIDFTKTQKLTGEVTINTLYNFIESNNIDSIDLLCMDVQGYELNILKGAENFIKNIKFIIIEEPKAIINTNYLPKGIHSKYVNAPSSQEIKEFMSNNGFIEVERISENAIEDNVMYKNTCLICLI